MCIAECCGFKANPGQLFLPKSCPGCSCVVCLCASASFLTHANTTPVVFIIVVLCAFQSGGRFLQEGMEENSTLTVFDLRLSEIAQESEYVINKTVKDNLDRDRKIAT